MATNAVPDTQLGLSAEEIQLLRQGQAALGGGSTSSRAASRASSQGLLLLDSSSLAALGRYFDRLMANIEQNIQYLSEQAQMFTQVQYDRAGNIIDGADAEIARYQQILVQLDELETDFDRIAHIKEIVKGYRSRVEELERDLETSGSSSRHHKHSSHKHSHSHSHSHKHGSSHKSRH
ncbi:ead/Ea22-like protein domain-containing protein [Pochonia chlamydosporia 170]|uniref:Biogenesis of lysosome-related organelles complex 1 subunit CNL1 n=1 Tax=Pochonia chlamydosporia 170 TaxID=1380566 RepID=A0A179FNR9_METCM|nr:ead/Ea22-like protein domain-containing protein [Pochonia chlamydosporia 170]OAQ67305.1 ead/Ea22-like protein domain-containing protein [Pochonia chlamydosporia 170]